MPTGYVQGSRWLLCRGVHNVPYTSTNRRCQLHIRGRLYVWCVFIHLHFQSCYCDSTTTGLVWGSLLCMSTVVPGDVKLLSSSKSLQLFFLLFSGACDAGYILNPDNLTQCWACPLDTFQPDWRPMNGTECLPCAPGTATRQNASATEDLCEGMYRPVLSLSGHTGLPHETQLIPVYDNISCCSHMPIWGDDDGRRVRSMWSWLLQGQHPGCRREVWHVSDVSSRADHPRKWIHFYQQLFTRFVRCWGSLCPSSFKWGWESVWYNLSMPPWALWSWRCL